jgi:DNA processing protein
LYVRGVLWTWPKIAFVWSRKVSTYWNRAIESLVPEVSRYFTIVSGGAYWCDTLAHVQALDAGNKTVSVVWTSICEDYPQWNKWLYDRIVANGWAVVSIFPLWVPGSGYNFPIRNEIVAWLSVGTVVIEAQKKSGSLITAQLCLDLWKDLFAVPWEIFKINSAGCNNLVKKWEAKMVTNSLDILEEYNLWSSWALWAQEKIEFDDELEEKIYNCLLLESFTGDDLARKLWLDISSLCFKLSMLEIRGFIKKTLWWKFEVK